MPPHANRRRIRCCVRASRRASPCWWRAPWCCSRPPGGGTADARRHGRHRPGAAAGRQVSGRRQPRRLARADPASRRRPGAGRAAGSPNASAAAQFRSIDDLARVRGIGPRTLERIRPYLLPIPERRRVGESLNRVRLIRRRCKPRPHGRATHPRARHAISPRSPVRARRRSARGHRRAGAQAARGPPRAGADGRHRLGQDVHDGERHPAAAAADAGAVAQQDAGGPALPRVQGVLSAQRGALFRQLLRLLPARSVHSAARHLHREGRLDQRGDRPAAAGDDQLAGEPAGRDRRGQRVVHLRLGLAGGLQGDDGRR